VLKIGKRKYFLALLVWVTGSHPAYKKTGCWLVGGDDLTGAMHVL